MEIPVEARQQTPEGAVAFVKFYFDQVNKAWMTPDVTLLPGLAQPECKSCSAFQSSAEKLLEAKQHYKSAGSEVKEAAVVDATDPSRILMSLSIRQLPALVVDDSGAVVSTKNDKLLQVRALVIWRESEWSMLDAG